MVCGKLEAARKDDEVVKAVLAKLIAVTALTLAPVALPAVTPDALPSELEIIEEPVSSRNAALPPSAAWKIVAGGLFLWGLRSQSRRR